MPYKPGLIYKDGTPIAYDPADFPGSFDRALSVLGYDEWRKRQKAHGNGAHRIGIGVSCYAQGSGRARMKAQPSAWTRAARSTSTSA